MAAPVAPTERRLGAHSIAELQVFSVCVALALVVSPAVVRLWSPGWRGYFNATLLLPADIGLVIVLIVSAPAVVRALRSGSLGPASAGWTVMAGVLAVVFPWHPSGRGVITVFHIGAAAVLAAAVGLIWRSPWRRTMAAIVCGVGILESFLAVAQRAVGGPVGLPAFLETPLSLYRFGGYAAPDGSFPHPYVLAAASLVFALVAVAMAFDPLERRPLAWASAAAMCEVPVALTSSRDAALGLVLLGSCLLVVVHRRGWQRPVVGIAAVLLLGIAVPAAVNLGGWRARAATSASSDPGTGRSGLTGNALTLLGEHPLTGVGPGRYVFALEARFGLSQQRQPQQDQAVHTLPLIAGVEGGVAALLAAVAALAWVGRRALRTGPLAVGVFLAFLPFCLFDQLTYVSAQGVVVCALWLGLLDGLLVASRRSAEEVVRPL